MAQTLGPRPLCNKDEKHACIQYCVTQNYVQWLIYVGF